MAQDVLEYFTSYLYGGKGNVVRVGTQLARGGITDMDVLCRLLEQEPTKVLAIRNIGEKSMALAQLVCNAYRRDR